MLHGLDRNGSNLRAPERLDESTRVRAICLVSFHVRSDVLRRQERDIMASSRQAPRPVVCSSACLHHDASLRATPKEPSKPAPREPVPFGYLPRLIGNSDFEDVLPEINRDSCALHLNLLEKMRGWVGAGFRGLRACRGVLWCVRAAG